MEEDLIFWGTFALISFNLLVIIFAIVAFSYLSTLWAILFVFPFAIGMIYFDIHLIAYYIDKYKENKENKKK